MPRAQDNHAFSLHAHVQTQSGSVQGLVQQLGNLSPTPAVTPRLPKLKSIAQAGEIEHDPVILAVHSNSGFHYAHLSELIGNRGAGDYGRRQKLSQIVIPPRLKTYEVDEILPLESHSNEGEAHLVLGSLAPAHRFHRIGRIPRVVR